MKKINWFKYRQYLGYAFDLGRTITLLLKHWGISKYFMGFYSHMIEAPNIIWIIISNFQYQIITWLSGIVPVWVFELSLINFGSFRLDMAIKFVMG